MSETLRKVGRAVLAVLDKRGHELLDKKPVAMPVGFKRPETLAEQVQRLVRRQVSEYAAAQGRETFEESEDFDVDDEFDPRTPYEAEFDPILGREVTPAEVVANPGVYARRIVDAERRASEAEARLRAINNPPETTSQGATRAFPAGGAAQGRVPAEGPQAKPGETVGGP